MARIEESAAHAHLEWDTPLFAGGVTVSYFEWVQDLGRLFWSRNEIREKLAEKLSDACDCVWELSIDARGLYP